MRKHNQIKIMSMAGYNISFYSKQSDKEQMREKADTSWLWVISSDYSVLIGWKEENGEKKLISYNKFLGKGDFYKKGFKEADPELVTSILTILENNMKQFLTTASPSAA